MKNRYHNNRTATGIRIDYVESKLDESIRSLKETNEKFEARHKAERQEAAAKLEADRQAAEARLEADRRAAENRLENERIAAENRLANDRLEFEKRFAEERKEWRSTKRWLYLNFGAAVALIITVVVAIVGFFITNGNVPA